MFTVWKWKRDDTVLLLHPAENALFPGSESSTANWTSVAQIAAISPLKRPIPAGYDLYVAASAAQFPYNTINIHQTSYYMYPPDKGTFFLGNKMIISQLRTVGFNII